MSGVSPSNRGDAGQAAAAHRRWQIAGGFAAVALLLQTSCVVLPVRFAPGASGRIVDATSGEPIADALVVVRFEGHYDDNLPDREVLGHRETRTDATGSFSVDGVVRPGLSAWPMYQSEARVVAVMHDGYRCTVPRADASASKISIALQPALDAEDRRASCRPVAAARGEAAAYMTAWRALFPERTAAPGAEIDRSLDRLLAARSVFGFGENCEGPALDLALAVDGRRAAFALAGEIRIVELRGSRTLIADAISRDTETRPRRLAWTSSGDLLLWEPADPGRSVSHSIFSMGRLERIWSAAGPAARAAPGASPATSETEKLDSIPLAPEDLNDESDSRWLGRSFVQIRTPDPETGLPRDALRVYPEYGTSYSVALPGEPCGPPGRFGRPQYRITADGRTGLDLRFVEGGCHVVRTDLENGEWSVIDGAQSSGVCRTARQIPAAHFASALRGYARELKAAVAVAGADPTAPYALRIDANGETQLDTRSFSGDLLTVDVPPFPLRTPLSRIEVSILGGVPRGPSRRGATGLQPL